MARKIVVTSGKGGVGKTTTCVNLGIGLARAGKKVLLVEADAQGSMAVSLGIAEPDELDVTLVNIMEKVINDEDVEPGEGIIRHEEGIDFIPANIELCLDTITVYSQLGRIGMNTSSSRDAIDMIACNILNNTSKLYDVTKGHRGIIGKIKRLVSGR